jgi:hypothetical protein
MVVLSREGNRLLVMFHLLIVILAALICMIGSTAASGFSSQISISIGDEMLVSGANCMAPNQTALAVLNATNLELYLKPYMNLQREAAAAYAKQCFKPTNSGALGCGTFVRTKVVSTINKSAKCPFAPSICKSQDRNIILDTGLLDSHAELGLNAPPNERFQFRRVLHCAPLVTDGYTSVHNRSAERSFTRFHYGRTMSYDAESAINYTFEASNNEIQDRKKEEWHRDDADYELG